MGDSGNCSEVYQLRVQTRQGQRLNAAELDCALNSGAGIVRPYNDHNWDEDGSGKHLLNILKPWGLVNSDLAAVLQAIRDNVAKSSIQRKRLAVNASVDAVQKKLLGAQVAIRMIRKTPAAAPKPSGVYNLNFPTPAAPAQVIGGAALNVQQPASQAAQVISFGPPIDDGFDTGTSTVAAMVPPAGPMKVAGIPVLYLAIGGAALAGAYLLTRKKKGA